MAHSPATGQRAGGPVAPLSIRGLLELQDELDPDDAAQHVSGDRHGGEGQANKKRKLAKTADFTRRKRAATACQFCRLRKTKCDNVRPCCGYCERQKAKCIYGESEWLEDTVEDPDQSEGMGRRILKHLEEIKEMLATNQSRLPTNPSVNTPTVVTAATPRTTLQTTTTPRTIGQSPWTDATDNGSQTTSTKAPASNAVSRPHALARCESLLRWPIFNGIVSEEVARIESFLTDSDYKARQQDANAPTRHASQEQTGKGIRDDAFVPLCRKFLTHVHPRNPVLDADELMRFARDAEEHGVKWDSESCLVLLACALATYTNPWEPPVDLANDAAATEAHLQDQADSRMEADVYYLAAKKRLGLLGHSIQDIQCLFLASMYDKYCLQPLQAWFHLREASVRLHAHLLGQRQQLGKPGRAVSSQHLEQRVYWSTWRAENELLLEAGLPTSGLEHLSYPDAFPSPPPDLSSDQFGVTSPESIGTPQDQQRQLDEKGWCYYLAEISLRRAIDETVQVLYQRGDYFWLQNQDYLVRHYHDFEQQITLWQHHLPAGVQFSEDQPNDNEFSHFLFGRFYEWRELVLRPIVYYVLHSPAERVHPETVHHAQKGIDLCAALVSKYSSHLRHGGSWFFARKSFLCACLILAVILEPNRGLRPPPNWADLVKIALETLKRWAIDASDIWKMYITLDSMYRAICNQTGCQFYGTT
ncbi:hypothetical protein BGZ61DRAFT_349210 [Ilyonectria robusta]|uniref:uncharacterized protein n=1 Tax=Ilyonectria robusta TaxID=1079257 RepID=UPI001E8CA710|nr:uncharacterized protein BGZ61DRAFT_349210 [Ilyonectria robusta]KAH8714585.1 hypothetical protein BGZ61DRAFT_349210 [Ilyonectria robusta]